VVPTVTFRLVFVLLLVVTDKSLVVAAVDVAATMDTLRDIMTALRPSC